MKSLLVGALLALLPAAAIAQQSMTVPGQNADLTAYSTTSQTQQMITSLSPVQSVNGNVGVVTVPTFQRLVGSISTFTTTNGYSVGTYTFPSSFQTTPTCLTQIRSASTTYTYSFPVVTSISTTAVTVQLRASPVSLTIAALGSVSLSTTVPTGTSVDLLCLAPLN
ncbi:MAG: hypothetical protein PW791_09160 [Neorhizobium sp.]|nr:hypothetical protein [Neorhizobium sp.]